MGKAKKQPAIVSDYGTPELCSRPGYAREYASQHQKRTRNQTQVPIDYYLKRNIITSEQHEAGDRLFRDFYYAGFIPSITARYDNKPGGGRGDELSQQQAMEYYRRAISCLGMKLRQVAVRVCCHGEMLEAVERELSLPVRSGKVMLGAGLEQLAMHYGMITQAAVIEPVHGHDVLFC